MQLKKVIWKGLHIPIIVFMGINKFSTCCIVLDLYNNYSHFELYVGAGSSKVDEFTSETTIHLVFPCSQCYEI